MPTNLLDMIHIEKIVTGEKDKHNSEFPSPFSTKPNS